MRIMLLTYFLFKMFPFRANWVLQQQ